MQVARSHIANRKEKAAQLKAVVMNLLNWDEMQYATFQYESGLAYLRFYIPHDKWGQDMLHHSKLFWNWWKNQWSLREEAFVDEHQEQLQQLQRRTLVSMYFELHDAAKLASDIYPNRTVLDESYNQMIREMHKEEIYG